MTNGNIRKKLEAINLLDNPKYVRQMWRSVGNAIAQRPATEPVLVVDKDGNLVYDSMVEKYSYDALMDDIHLLADTERTAPTMLEMILACQMVHARHNPAAATFVRDTVGAKPVDESKIETTVNQFEQLTDDELEALMAYREQRDANADNDQTPIVDASAQDAKED